MKYADTTLAIAATAENPAAQSVKPADLKRAGYLVGPQNDEHIAECVFKHHEPFRDNLLCAWGANAAGLSRPKEVLTMLRNFGVRSRALHFTNAGIPSHPLMLPYSCRPTYIDAGVQA